MRYSNHLDSSKALSLVNVIKWQLFKSRHFRQETSSLLVMNQKDKLSSKKDFICWLGHASFLIQIDKKRILLDPVLGDIPFYKRLIPSPYSHQELGEIDYIFISHTHYDHFDKPSIQKLLDKNATFITPLGMEYYLKKIDKNINVKTFDWYQSLSDDSVKLSFVPAKHWGRRGLLDTNRALWGGLVIESSQQSIYFSGDTAYEQHFKEIGLKYKIDYALLPIGAYSPREVMSHNHLNPQEAYQAFLDLRANSIIPMHYGTFKLTDEPLDEPEKWIDTIFNTSSQLFKLHVGEVTMINS